MKTHTTHLNEKQNPAKIPHIDCQTFDLSPSLFLSASMLRGRIFSQTTVNRILSQTKSTNSHHKEHRVHDLEKEAKLCMGQYHWIKTEDPINVYIRICAVVQKTSTSPWIVIITQEREATLI